jgi:hypothetical protein
MKIKVDTMSLEQTFVNRFRSQGKTEQYIWDAFQESRNILPLTEKGIRMALKRYDLTKKIRDYAFNNARDFRARANARLNEKLEQMVEGIAHDPSVISPIKLELVKPKGYTKPCGNCNTDLQIVTVDYKQNKVLTGDPRNGGGERRYIPEQKHEFLSYLCLECGASYSR